MVQATSSLNAGSLTRGNRVLVTRDEDRQYSPNCLGHDASSDRVLIVAGTHRVGDRVLITFTNAVIVGAMINERARVVL